MQYPSQHAGSRDGVPLISHEALGTRREDNRPVRHAHARTDPLMPRRMLPEPVSTEIMIADIFTKPLDKTAFLKFRAVLLNCGRGKNA